MPLFIWKPSYELGTLEIAQDHRHLVGLINELYEAMKVGHGYELISHLIDQLLEYALNHFETEEGFMRASNYPHMALHAQEHQEFRKKVMAMDQHRRQGESLPSTEMMDFLCEWSRQHVLDSDKDFGLFMNSQNRQ